MSYNIYQELDQQVISKQKIEQIINLILQEDNADGDVSVHIVDEEKITELNKKYRNNPEPTDVLSFSMKEGFNTPGEANDLGDIFICLPIIKTQAEKNEISKKEEFVRMLIHGILHLLGYDHKKDEEAKRMFSFQEKIINKVNEKIFN